MNTEKVNPPEKLIPTEKERRLLEIIRGIEHGEIRVVIQDSNPIRVEELKKSIKL